jgi:hypothetical protein
MTLISALVMLASTPVVPGCAACGVGRAGVRSLLATAAERRAQAYRDGLVVAIRADRQHAAVLAGDDRFGISGQWQR